MPIGSAADRLEAESAAVPAEDSAATLSAEDASAEALSAEDFWGESSGALHQPVDLPFAAEEISARGAAVSAAVPSEPEAPWPLPAQPEEIWLGERQRRLRVRRSPSIAAVIFGLLVIAVAAAVVLSQVGSHSRPVQSRSAAVHGSGPAAPVLLHQLPGVVAAIPSSLEREVRTVSTQVETRSRARARTRARALAEAKVRRAQARARAERRARAARSSHTTTTAGSSADAGASSAVASPSPTRSVSSNIPAPSSATVAPASTSSGAAGSSAGSGPGGLGEVVGQQCNPQCAG